jgi:hypothetical protein
MNKIKNSKKEIGKYFREVSVVVIGVAITLSVSFRISQWNDKRDMTLYLNAVNLELEENLQILDKEALYLEDWENYAKYLYSLDKKSIPEDSIRTIGYPGLGAIHNIVFQTSAFEMFKGSGAMRLLNDKELLQSIWGTYLNLERVKSTLDLYYQLKMDECVNHNQLELAGVPIPIPLYDFFYSYANFGALRDCEKNLKEINITIEKLEKFLKIKP